MMTWGSVREEGMNGRRVRDEGTEARLHMGCTWEWKGAEDDDHGVRIKVIGTGGRGKCWVVTSGHTPD